MKKILSAFFAAGILMSATAIQASDVKDAVVDAAKEAVTDAAKDAVADAVAPKVEGDCIVHYVRTACEGQEETSYKKCDGEKECDKAKEAASAEECQAAALKSCGNSRLDITKSKVVTATYKGEAIKPDADSDNMDFCLNYENREAEYNQCPEDQAAPEAAPAE